MIPAAAVSRKMAAISAALVLAGCANIGLGEAECRGAGWYDLGKRDGEIYGSRDGNMEYRQRTGWGGGPD